MRAALKSQKNKPGLLGYLSSLIFFSYGGGLKLVWSKLEIDRDLIYFMGWILSIKDMFLSMKTGNLQRPLHLTK